MADICKCEGKECPIKDKCLRHTSITDKWNQTFFMEMPYLDGNCEFFIPIDDKKINELPNH